MFAPLFIKDNLILHPVLLPETFNNNLVEAVPGGFTDTWRGAFIPLSVSAPLAFFSRYSNLDHLMNDVDPDGESKGTYVIVRPDSYIEVVNYKYDKALSALKYHTTTHIRSRSLTLATVSSTEQHGIRQAAQVCLNVEDSCVEALSRFSKAYPTNIDTYRYLNVSANVEKFTRYLECINDPQLKFDESLKDFKALKDKGRRK